MNVILARSFHILYQKSTIEGLLLAEPLYEIGHDIPSGWPLHPCVNILPRHARTVACFDARLTRLIKVVSMLVDQGLEEAMLRSVVSSIWQAIDFLITHGIGKSKKHVITCKVYASNIGYDSPFAINFPIIFMLFGLGSDWYFPGSVNNDRLLMVTVAQIGREMGVQVFVLASLGLTCHSRHEHASACRDTTVFRRVFLKVKDKRLRSLELPTLEKILRFGVVSAHDGCRFSPYHD